MEQFIWVRLRQLDKHNTSPKELRLRMAALDTSGSRRIDVGGPVNSLAFLEIYLAQALAY